MPEKKTIERARRAKREGKAPTTVAGEFVREEIEHIRRGKHGARSPKQAIAIGLSKARRAGVDLPPPQPRQTKEKTRKSAARAYERGQEEGPLADGRGTPSKPSRRIRKRTTSPKRSQAIRSALKREGRGAASRRALSGQAKSAARRRSNG
ncbi:MAG: DUF6496 domain-containing protein [Planctomycetota bacterium]